LYNIVAGRFENLEEDFYDGRLAEIVGERYRDDAKVFGYSF
jgi:hypothetical protein